MSLKIIKLTPALARLAIAAIAIICVALTWFFIKWNFANLVSSRLDRDRPESKIVADWLTGVGPDDPQTHFAAARLFENTFEPGDVERSLSEYELAAALSPHNYLVWLELGKARDHIGDQAGSEAAFRRSLELAPNYASVQWAFGNSLLRHGNPDDGFALIAKAAASDPQYAGPAVSTALDMFDGDVAEARHELGDSAQTNAAMASVLAGRGKFADAFDAWSRLGVEEKRGDLRQTGERLAGQLLVAKKYQLAAQVTSDLLPDEAERPVIGKISNGGFEGGVKQRNAGVFEWQIAEGAEPQIGLSESQKHSGRYSLLMSFNTYDPAAFRPIMQTVAVVPGATYEFEAYYRSDLKTTAVFKWQVVDAAAGTVLATTDPLNNSSDWTTVKTKFTIPPSSDGVIIRFTREGCGTGACAVNGKVAFDDISVRQM